MAPVEPCFAFRLQINCVGTRSNEAAYTDKAGKKHEVLVKPDGTETKD
jgi:hypothetical protein